MRHLLIAIIAFLPFIGESQLTQTIRGRVIDKYSEELIPDAKVFVFGKVDSLRQKSNIDGEFRFENVPVGRYTIIATYPGFEAFVQSNIEITTSKEIVLDLTLVEEVQKIDEVKVTAREKGSTINQLATVSARSFSIEESQRYAGSFNDVARMAQNFAGVQGADDSRNDIIVRGNSPTGVLYRLEGIDIPNPNHFARFGTTGGPISMLNNNVLANSDFFTGAFPAEYGNALASVFDLKMRNGNNEKFEFMGQIGFNGLEGMVEGPLSKKSKASFLINYRYSTLKLFQLMGLEFGTAALPKYQDMNFKLRFPGKNSETQVFGVGGLSNINILSSDTEEQNDIWGSTGSDLYFTSNSGMFGATHKRRINANSFFKVLVGMQAAYNNARSDTLDVNGENPFTTFASRSTTSKQTTSFIYQNKISSRHLIKTGIINDIYFNDLSDSIYRPGLMGFVNLRDHDGATVLIRPHFQHRFRMTENATLVSGLYAQYLTLGGQWAVEPRIGFDLKMKHNQRFTVGYGMHSQMAPMELYFDQLIDANGDYYTPNTDLEFTRSQHLIMGYQKRFNHGINVKVETYGQYLTNVPVERQATSYSLLNFGASFLDGIPDTLVNDGKGYNYGVELTIEKFLDNGFYFLVTASLFESKYQGSDGVWRNTAFNGNHTLNTLAGYEFRFGGKKEDARFKSALSVDIKFTWNGGGRYTEILLDQSIAANQEIRDWNNAFEQTYIDYLKGNFRIAYKLIGKKATQEWALDIQNFTDRDNIFYEEYNAFAGQIRTIYQNGILPVFQYRVTF